jgi:hypothetical protein
MITVDGFAIDACGGIHNLSHSKWERAFMVLKWELSGLGARSRNPLGYWKVVVWLGTVSLDDFDWGLAT